MRPSIAPVPKRRATRKARGQLAGERAGTSRRLQNVRRIAPRHPGREIARVIMQK
jgi:hypothetical protein